MASRAAATMAPTRFNPSTSRSSLIDIAYFPIERQTVLLPHHGPLSVVRTNVQAGASRPLSCRDCEADYDLPGGNIGRIIWPGDSRRPFEIRGARIMAI